MHSQLCVDKCFLTLKKETWTISSKFIFFFHTSFSALFFCIRSACVLVYLMAAWCFIKRMFLYIGKYVLYNYQEMNDEGGFRVIALACLLWYSMCCVCLSLRVYYSCLFWCSDIACASTSTLCIDVMSACVCGGGVATCTTTLLKAKSKTSR